MIQYLRPAASAAGTAAFRRGIFYPIGALRRGGVYRPAPVLRMLTAGGRGAQPGRRCWCCPHRRYRRSSGTAQLGFWDAGSWRAAVCSPAGAYRRGAAHQTGGNCRSPGRLLRRKEDFGMGGGRVHRNGGGAASAVFPAGASDCGRCARWKVLRPAFAAAPAGARPHRAGVGTAGGQGCGWRCCWQRGYAALDSRPYGSSLALALYPLKETE